MRKMSTESERIDWITQLEASGEAQRVWCKTQGLSLHTFRKWVGNYRKSQKTKEEIPSQFIPLTEPLRESEVESPLELIYPNGVQLRIPAYISTLQLKDFLHLYDQ